MAIFKISILSNSQVCKWHLFLFSHFFVVPQVSPFWGTEKLSENKKIKVILPVFLIGKTRVKAVFLSTPNLCHFRFLNNRNI